MFRLMTFETFQPKNLDSRKAELAKKEAQTLQEYKLFVKQFKTNLQAMQGLKVKNKPEQIFIDLFQNLTLSLNHEYYPYTIYAYQNKDGKMLFRYDWKENSFYVYHNQLNSEKFNLIRPYAWKNTVQKYLKKYFYILPYISQTA